MRHKVLILWLAVVVATLPLGAAPTAAHADSPRQPYRNGELIVKLRQIVNPVAFAAASGLRLREERSNGLDHMGVYRFSIADGSSPSDKAVALASRAGVLYAEPNYVGQVPEATRRSSWVVGADAGAYVAQWAGPQISLPAAHQISQGEGVTVAILDTGVDFSHPALAGHLLAGYDFVDNDDIAQEEQPADLAADNSGESAFGHGTHVAGIVALSAPAAKIMPLRTLNPWGVGDLWTQAAALHYAVAHGASVINLSFSFGTRSQLFDDVMAETSCSAYGAAICRAQSQPGAVVVAAAGNSGERTREWPGASTAPGIIGVAASTQKDTLADFSTYGGQIVVAAPGEGITSTVPGSPEGAYATWSGTSMAAPFVSGVAALVRAHAPALSPNDVIQRITSADDPIDGPVHGRLNALTALADKQ